MRAAAPTGSVAALAKAIGGSGRAPVAGRGIAATITPTDRSTPRHASPRRAWRHAAAVVGATTAVTLGLGSGAAWAYFDASGTGTGHAAVGTIKPLSLLFAAGSPGDSLFPGGSADLHLDVTNPNSYPVTIIGLHQTGIVTVSGGNDCDAANASLTLPTASLDIPIPPGSSSVTVPTGISMGTSAFSGCQNASFFIPLTVSVQS